jgi:hypothetical protein
MAFTRIQATPQRNGDGASTVLTFASPPTVGNAIIVGVLTYSNSSGAPVSCIDSFGNPYMLAASKLGGPDVAIYYCSKITASGTPFTVTPSWTASTDYLAVAFEISGVGSGLVNDQVATNGGGGTTPSTGTTAALTADEVLLVAIHAIDGNQSSITVQSVSPAWTQEAEFLSALDVPGEIDSRILASGALGTTQSCNWTDTGFGSWNAAIVAFKMSTAPAVGERVQPFVIVPV